MSFGKTNLPTESPSIAGLDSSDTSSNQQAVPVPWWIGPDRRPLTWIVPEVYNRESVKVTQDGGKAGEITTGYKEYVDVAGIAGLGLLRRIRYIESGNTRVWEGNITRPDDPAHPDYWEVKIATSVGDFYITWGRPNQPEDTHLLGPLGAKDASLKHPAYGRQIRVVIIRYYCGQGATTVPNTVLGIDREPTPAIGAFPVQGSDQGESMVAGELELLTDPVFGAGLDAKYFTVAEWQNLSAAVIGRVGCHAPSLDRARALRDVIKDFQGYYDGWKRLQNGQIKPGWFPHDGTVPDGITELSVHDFVTQPKTRVTTPSAAINEVVVTYRDVTDYLKKKPASESASDNVRARKAHDPRMVEMLGIVTLGQAQAFAAEAAASAAEGEFEAEGAAVRRSRLKWANGTPLRAGENVNIDLIGPQVDQVSRITKRVDFFRGPPQIDFMAERGVYPTPYVPPSSLRPDIGAPAPLEIARARLLELTPALYGSTLGLPIAALAMRPQAAFSGLPALTTKDVIGFNFWHSATGSSYDSLGRVGTWAVRATLRTALISSTADATVQLALDPVNLDLARIAPQSVEAQKNNELLIVIGDELFSAGSMSIAALNYDVGSKRARLGSLPTAHAAGDECWLVFREEITAFVHGAFVENTNRYFKLQPYTRSAAMPLSDADPLVYHFRDRAPEKPVVTIDAMPAGLVVGVTYGVSGQISDVNGDLKSYAIEAALLTGPGGTIDSKIVLQSGDFDPDDMALYAYKTTVVFPAAGTWRIIVRAYDQTGKYTRAQSAELTVVAGNGGYNGPDDGVTPNAVSGVTVTPGFGMFVLNFTRPSNTRLDMVRIYESATTVRPAQWSFVALEPQEVLFRTGLPNATTRSYWLEPLASNGRTGPISGPYTATTIDGIGLSHLVPGLTMVEVVTAKPATGNFKGRTIFLTTDNKLYRWENDVIGTGTAYWSTKIDGADLAVGTLVAGAFSAGCVTAFAVGTNEIIANTANLKDAIITGAKIALLEVGTGHMQDLSVTTLKVGIDAITAATSAMGINRSFVSGDVTSLVKATLTVFGGRIDLDFSLTMRFLTGGSTQFQVLRDGVEIDRWHLTLPFANWESRTFNSQDTPGAGKHTYEVKIYQPNDGGKIEKPKLKIQETKR